MNNRMKKAIGIDENFWSLPSSTEKDFRKSQITKPPIKGYMYCLKIVGTSIFPKGEDKAAINMISKGFEDAYKKVWEIKDLHVTQELEVQDECLAIWMHPLVVENLGYLYPNDGDSWYYLLVFHRQENDTVNQENDTVNRLTKVIDLIKNDKDINLANLAKTLSVSEATIKRDIKKLKNNNKIKRVGSDKSGYWLVI